MMIRLVMSALGSVWVAEVGASLSLAGLVPKVYSVLLNQGQSVIVKRFVKE